MVVRVETTCSGKIPFQSRQDAKSQIRRMLKSKITVKSSLNAYKCPFCKQFHLGNNYTGKKL